MPELSAAEFERLFRTFHGRLCGFAFGYLHDEAAAQEVVQDVFLALWEKRDRLEIHTSMRAYLFRSVRNRSLNRSARARTEEQWLAAHASDDVLPASDYSDTGERVRAAVAALPPACRSVLTLRWQDEMSYAEIADALQVAVKTVENNLARAREMMRRKLPDLVQE